jgi:hypothetical protein
VVPAAYHHHHRHHLLPVFPPPITTSPSALPSTPHPASEPVDHRIGSVKLVHPAMQKALLPILYNFMHTLVVIVNLLVHSVHQPSRHPYHASGHGVCLLRSHGSCRAISPSALPGTRARTAHVVALPMDQHLCIDIVHACGLHLHTVLPIVI